MWWRTGTVGTYLKHPTRGKTQLYRRRVEDLFTLRAVFANPRVHTHDGYSERVNLREGGGPCRLVEAPRPARGNMFARASDAVGGHCESAGCPTSTDFVVASGATCVSYLPSTEGFDTRSLVTLETPSPVYGFGGTSEVTAVGTVYAKTMCFDGKEDRVLTIRFDAAVMPSLRSSGIGLFSTQSLVYDGGLHALKYHPVSIDEIAFPGEIKIQMGAIGALRHRKYRVEISAPYNESRCHNLVPLTFCSQQEIEALAPTAPQSNLLRRGLFANALA